MFARTAVLMSLAASTLATVYVTSPVASTTCVGGSSCNITWQDDGNVPSLDTFGNAQVGIYAGNVNTQILLQDITDAVNVATTSTISFTVDSSIGPNDNIYFIRFMSATAKDPTDATKPAMAFSAKFTLNNMSGTFNSTVQGLIDASPSSGSGSATSGAATSSAAKSTGSSSPTTSKATSSTTASASAKSALVSSAADRNGVAAGALGAAGVVAALFGLAF